MSTFGYLYQEKENGCLDRTSTIRPLNTWDACVLKVCFHPGWFIHVNNTRNHKIKRPFSAAALRDVCRRHICEWDTDQTHKTQQKHKYRLCVTIKTALSPLELLCCLISELHVMLMLPLTLIRPLKLGSRFSVPPDSWLLLELEALSLFLARLCIFTIVIGCGSIRSPARLCSGRFNWKKLKRENQANASAAVNVANVSNSLMWNICLLTSDPGAVNTATFHHPGARCS